MKKSLIILGSAAFAAVSALPFSAGAADDTVYGTMNIPYADFYEAELNNDIAVDAVSSATSSKWSMNQTGYTAEDGKWVSGGLAAGTYNDGNGRILGVNYPVAISKADLDKLSDNYGFIGLSDKPAAYKPVTVEDGRAVFGKLVDTDGEEVLDGDMTVSNISSYGDYQIQVNGIPQNADIYGVIVSTAGGTDYGMRALENIWRNGSVAWSAGIKEKESHGNVLSSEHYKSSQGQTITDVRFITLSGYSTLSGQNGYLGVKTVESLNVGNGKAGSGSVTFDVSALPADFSVSGEVAEGFTVSGDTISYTNALPGNYTVTVSDKGGKYSEIKGQFTLSTDSIPVKYSGGKLVADEGFSEADAANFIKNITSVTVGETAYNTGRRGVTVIDPESGEIKLDAKSGDSNVFGGPGSYRLAVTSTGYDNVYEFEINVEAAAATASSTAASTSAKTTSAATGKKASASKSKDGSPKTGDAAVAVPLTALAAAAFAALAFRRRNK